MHACSTNTLIAVCIFACNNDKYFCVLLLCVLACLCTYVHSCMSLYASCSVPLAGAAGSPYHVVCSYCTGCAVDQGHCMYM